MLADRADGPAVPGRRRSPTTIAKPTGSSSARSRCTTRLAADHDCIVVEGAGSAAEVNLYARDIANMRLAERLQLPIVLVADIERGGVFAQVCGTIALLPAPIRKLVRGVIVNKFRGDPALFEDGVRILEALSGVPVLGVLPVRGARPSE